MRLRDSKLQCFLAFLIFSVVILFNIFYISSYKDRLYDVSKESVQNDSKISLTSMLDKITAYQIEIETGLTEDSDLTMVDGDSLKTGITTTLFNDRNTTIQPESAVETQGDPATYYYYFYHMGSGFTKEVYKTNLENILPDTEEGSITKRMIVLGENNTIIASNGVSASGISTLFDASANTEIRQNLKDGINRFAVDTKINGNRYFASYVPLNKDTDTVTYFYVEVVDATPYLAELSQMLTFSYIFVGIIAAAMLSVLIIAIKIVKKQNKIVILSRKAATRPDSFIVRTNSKGKVIYSYHKMKEFKDNDILDHPFDFITDDGRRLKECLKAESNHVCHVEVDGIKHYLNVMVYPFAGTYYFIGTNVTVKEEQFVKLRDLTSKNLITMLPNFYQLSGDFNHIKKEGFNKLITFGMIELVESYEIEKVFGTDLLNGVIAEAAQRIQKLLPNGSHIYHISKNVYLIVLISANSIENNRIFDEMHKVCQDQFTIDKNAIITKFKSASYDLKTQNNLEEKLEDIMFKLNITVAKAKESKTRDNLKYDANIQTEYDKKKEMQEDLTKAVENEEFVMYYQPQMDLQTNRISGFEALIRWDNPKYATTSPQEYIELAEKSGHILDIGNFVIKDVFRTAKILEEYGCHVSINVSPAQLFQAGFTTNLLEQFAENNLKKGSIAIEITETFLMENFKLIVDKLNILKNRGFSIHLDDFGTGYSSMLYLQQLPIDTIKTDKEFVKLLSRDAESQSIIKCIVELSKSLDLKVVSEGVETEEQKSILKDLKVDTIQGYLLSKPVRFDEALELVKKVNLKNKKGSA